MKKIFLLPLCLIFLVLLLIACSSSVNTPLTTVMPATEIPLSTSTLHEIEVTLSISTHQPTEMPLPISTLGFGSTMTGEKDGMILIYVPAGEFTMGSDADEALMECQKLRNDCQRDWFLDEEPPHSIKLDSFWIDQTEVTNAMYAKCVSEGACKEPTEKNLATHVSYYGNSEFDKYPVIYVNWNMANTYCIWAERRLPTEAQWEKAARGTDERIYPWGNAEPEKILPTNNLKASDTTKVGRYEAGKSFYGAYDMAGNVLEWVNDWYGETYYQISFSSNPLGPNMGQYRVLRGGAWSGKAWIGDILVVRSANRSWSDPSYSFSSIGFRCARSQ